MAHRLAIATVSLGRHDSHTLESKLAAAHRHGIQGVELFDSDLNKYAKAHGLSRLQAAEEIHKLCENENITIVVYASFGDFEGQPTPLDVRLEKAREWCDIVGRVGTDMIQIPSNSDPNANGDEAIIVRELRAIADLGAQQNPPIRFAYEALAWGKYAADWEESLRIVQLVNRSNFGLCLDTYHVLARLWADPMSKDGKIPGGDVALRDSLQRFRDMCPAEKIFYIQLSDAEKAVPPLLPGHPAYREDRPVLFSWCLYGRIFPFEHEYGAYLPMEEILRAWLVQSGWSGWVSMETFHYSMADEKAGPNHWAERAKISWERVQTILKRVGDRPYTLSEEWKTRKGAYPPTLSRDTLIQNMDFNSTVASVSVGNPGVHPVQIRPLAAARHGFEGMDIVEANVINQAKAPGYDDSGPSQIRAAEPIRKLCDELDLEVRVLQPFWFHEGLVGRTDHEAKI